MVYDWEDKRETCFRMYVIERRSLDDVMKFFKEEVVNHVTCANKRSKRAFQTQFRRWAFPSKQNPAHRNDALVARTRELWERNTSQKDMIVTLQAEGFSITERELMRLRSKHRLLLRGPNKVKLDSATEEPAIADSETTQEAQILQSHDWSRPFDRNFAPDQPSKRKERQDEMQADSNERWETKKRRRRTRTWAGLPADPAGPPRFPSETTLESSKVCLGLDNASYAELRNAFQAICQSQGIVKKTVVGPERWQAAKDELLHSNLQLLEAFQQAEQSLLDPMRLSLDVICMDVTKRLRNMEHKMTLAEAKNMLHINPEQGRHLRQALIDLLSANNFINKHESDNWDQLKQQWIADTGLGDRIPPPGHEGRDRALRAVQVVCRDIMKRWRDSQVAQRGGKLDNPAKSHPRRTSEEQLPTSFGQQQPLAAQHLQVTQQHIDSHAPLQDQNVLGEGYDFQIDPELLTTAKGNGQDQFGETLRDDGSHPSMYFS